MGKYNIPNKEKNNPSKIGINQLVDWDAQSSGNVLEKERMTMHELMMPPKNKNRARAN
jgi:hypothetical protein